MQETELNHLNYQDSPLSMLNFAQSVPKEQVVISSEPLRNLLCVTILDIISTTGDPLCICALTLARVFAAATCWTRPRAQQQVPQHFDCALANCFSSCPH